MKVSKSAGTLVDSVYTDANGLYSVGYKQTGKVATFNIILPAHGMSTALTMKANGIVQVDSIVV